jgi:hypothetical protein
MAKNQWEVTFNPCSNPVDNCGFGKVNVWVGEGYRVHARQAIRLRLDR